MLQKKLFLIFDNPCIFRWVGGGGDKILHCNGVPVTLLLDNLPLLVVTGNDFVTFKIEFGRNCNGAVIVKMGKGLKEASYFCQERK